MTDFEAIRKKFSDTNVFANAAGITAAEVRDGYAETRLTIMPGHSSTICLENHMQTESLILLLFPSQNNALWACALF